MQQKGRIIRVSDSEFRRLKTLIENLPPRSVNQRELLKDFHIFASALCTDKIIISNDLALFVHLQKLLNYHAPVARILWGNTLEEGLNCVAWIECGAKSERGRCIA
jgi:hypothetical protein